MHDHANERLPGFFACLKPDLYKLEKTTTTTPKSNKTKIKKTYIATFLGRNINISNGHFLPLRSIKSFLSSSKEDIKKDILQKGTAHYHKRLIHHTIFVQPIL